MRRRRSCWRTSCRKTAIEIRESQAGFHANDRDYPAGSWVILMNQPYTSMAKELFEVQRYPAALFTESQKPLDLPYDVTGWTLPMQMGVRVDPITDPITDDQLAHLKVVSDLDRAGSGSAGKRRHFCSESSVQREFPDHQRRAGRRRFRQLCAG